MPYDPEHPSHAEDGGPPSPETTIGCTWGCLAFFALGVVLFLAGFAALGYIWRNVWH